MRKLTSLLAILCSSWLCLGASWALTVDEVIKLKRAGVADSTIELLIKRSGDARAAGVWKQDGWIIHSTPIREPQANAESAQAAYPIFIQPRVSVGRR